jgi:hypothetical protein
MNTLVAVLRELIGLFVDDGALAVEIIAVVIVAAVATALLPNIPSMAGGILLIGCLGVLFANAVTAGRRQ